MNVSIVSPAAKRNTDDNLDNNDSKRMEKTLRIVIALRVSESHRFILVFYIHTSFTLGSPEERARNKFITWNSKEEGSKEHNSHITRQNQLVKNNINVQLIC